MGWRKGQGEGKDAGQHEGAQVGQDAGLVEAVARQPDAGVELRFEAGGLHFGERLTVRFNRTLRVPDEGTYPLPPGLGHFPAVPVDRVTDDAVMRQRGGIVLPLYQREALWMSFSAVEPIAVQVAAGLVCAVSGEDLTPTLGRDPQNYLVAPDQPWIDGFKGADGAVRQFVAAALGQGATVEEQLTHRPPVGGIQLRAFRLSEATRARLREERRREAERYADGLTAMAAPLVAAPRASRSRATTMGLGAGGRIRQVIARDRFALSDWETEPFGSVWVHLVGARAWTELTGRAAPPTPIDAATYARAGLPWFDLYDADQQDVVVSSKLAGVKGVTAVTGAVEDAPFVPTNVMELWRRGDWRGRDRVVVPPGHWSEWSADPAPVERGATAERPGSGEHSD